MSAVDLDESWIGRVSWLWYQDDVDFGEDTVARAWARIFGGEVPRNDAWRSSVDREDAVFACDDLGRVICSSYPGANQIGVLPGSPAAVLPRLVISGGQTGADRGGLDAALEVGVPVGGWAPQGWRSERGKIPERYRAHMREADSSDYDDRTRRNIEDADGTLVVSLRPALTGGSLKTKEIAERRGQAFLHVVASTDAVDREVQARGILEWIVDRKIGALNVAGPRESK